VSSFTILVKSKKDSTELPFTGMVFLMDDTTMEMGYLSLDGEYQLKEPQRISAIIFTTAAHYPAVITIDELKRDNIVMLEYSSSMIKTGLDSLLNEMNESMECIMNTWNDVSIPLPQKQERIVNWQNCK